MLLCLFRTLFPHWKGMIFLLFLSLWDIFSCYPILWSGGLSSDSITFRAIGYKGETFKLSVASNLESAGFTQLISVDIAEIFVSLSPSYPLFLTSR
jgi:hypothetical protein